MAKVVNLELKLPCHTKIRVDLAGPPPHKRVIKLSLFLRNNIILALIVKGFSRGWKLWISPWLALGQLSHNKLVKMRFSVLVALVHFSYN